MSTTRFARRPPPILLLLCSALTLRVCAAFQPPVSYEDADRRADAVLAKLSTEQKLQLISGHKTFYLKGWPELGIPELYMSDATAGVHLRREVNTVLAKSTAFPSPLGLAATWNPLLAYRMARGIGEECRAGGVAILLGPGMNMYRQSQCGRAFEYFGEDPHLAAHLIERYVTGVLETGTIPTLKHFLGNETDHHRRTSNSIIDERALHEIYLPPFKAGIDAGAMAVMTSYNQLNGEWCGQSRAVVTDLLRGELGFKWLVMSDWWSVWDAAKIIPSGLDLEMPGEKFIKADGADLLRAGRVTPAQVDRMAKSIIRTCIAMGLYDRPVTDPFFNEKFPEHAQTALEVAREAIVLLKNDGVLPLRPDAPRKILLTGLFVEKVPRGLGSAEVEGYDQVTLLQALRQVFGAQVTYVHSPSDEQLKAADVVLCSTGTQDSEGWDKPFALPKADEERVVRAVTLNPHTIVLVQTGAGIRLTSWNDRAAAVLYAWYPGQNGNRALAEVLSGAVNPSGKLPITLEKDFTDSPGASYLPATEKLYEGWGPDGDMTRPILNIPYRESIFIGYRWYEAKQIAPLYAFGHGLSYTTFEFSKLRIRPATLAPDGRISVEFNLTNTGAVAGAEVAQLYVRDGKSGVPRPLKELKGFSKIPLEPGQTQFVRFRLSARDFAYWDVSTHAWKAEPHDYTILIGDASDSIKLEGAVTLQ